MQTVQDSVLTLPCCEVLRIIKIQPIEASAT
jgi:hypothetical protein